MSSYRCQQAYVCSGSCLLLRRNDVFPSLTTRSSSIHPLNSVTATPKTMVSSVPRGYSRSRYALTDDDHAGWAVVASSVGLMVMVLFATIIICYRRMVRSHGRQYDACIAASLVRRLIRRLFNERDTERNSQVFAIPESAAVIVAASTGLGKSTSLQGADTQTTTELVRKIGQKIMTLCDLTWTRPCT